MNSLKSVFSRPFSFLLLTLFLSEAGSTMVTPLLPFLFFATDSSFFDVTTSHEVRAIGYGYATAAIRMGAFMASVFLGLAMDRWGRRSVLFLSCFGLACSMGALALSVDWGAFAMFIAGLFFCNLLYAGKQAAQTMVGDERGSKVKLFRMSLLQSGIALGACLGPMISGNLAHFLNILYWPFWLAAGFAIIAALVALFSIRETVLKPAPQAEGYRFLKVVKERPVQRLILQLFLTQLSWGTYYEFSPLVGKLSFGFTSQMTGFFVGMIAAWLVVGSALILPWLSKVISYGALKSLSVLGMLFGICLACFFQSAALFWVGAFFVAVGDVMIYILIVNELSDKVPSHYQGRMTGVVYTVITLTWSFTGVLGGYLTAYDRYGALWFSGLGVLILAGYFVWKGMVNRVNPQ